MSSFLTSTLNPPSLDDPVEEAVDVRQSHPRPRYSSLSCAQCNKVCTCVRAQMFVQFKGQSPNQLSLNTDIHEDKVSLCVVDGRMGKHSLKRSLLPGS